MLVHCWSRDARLSIDSSVKLCQKCQLTGFLDSKYWLTNKDFVKYCQMTMYYRLLSPISPHCLGVPLVLCYCSLTVSIIEVGHCDGHRHSQCSALASYQPGARPPPPRA